MAASNKKTAYKMTFEIQRSIGSFLGDSLPCRYTRNFGWGEQTKQSVPQNCHLLVSPARLDACISGTVWRVCDVKKSCPKVSESFTATTSHYLMPRSGLL